MYTCKFKIKEALVFVALLAVILHNTTFADTVEFPEEDLATETVVPVFDKTRSVLNRNVQTAKRIEMAGGMGMSLNEPFYNPLNFNANLTYYFSDSHAFNLSGTFFMTGLSQYGEQLKNGEGLTPGRNFDPERAPVPKWMALGNYQFNAYYGKISLTKQSVMNLTLFGLLGVGVLQTGGLSNMAVDIGFGQNFYFTPQFSARFDLKLVTYYGPDATSKDLDSSEAIPGEADFAKDWFFQTYLSLGLSYLF